MFWAVAHLRKNEITTNDGLINLFWPTYEGNFFDIGSKKLEEYIQQDQYPNTLFTFALFMAETKLSHSRKAYGLLDLMGDMGGIIEVLTFGCSFFINPISEHSFILKAL